MPNIKSVLKDVHKSRERHVRNKSAKAAIKTWMKKSKTMIASGDAQATEAVRDTVSLIDKTAAKGIIHKNAAARRKSRLMKRLAKAATA